jgi:hypothetical protein
MLLLELIHTVTFCLYTYKMGCTPRPGGRGRRMRLRNTRFGFESPVMKKNWNDPHVFLIK